MADNFNYLVSLDALLDARLGAVSVLDANYARNLVSNNWTSRKNDNYANEAPTFTKEQYSKLLKKGDLEVLKNSVPTLMTNYIFSTIREAFAESIVGDSVNRHIVTINLHPYTLSTEEREELLDILGDKIPNVDELVLTSAPMHLITPAYLRGNEITHYINYDFIEWLDMFTETVMNDPIPSVLMLCPKLLTKEPEDTEDPDMAKELLKDMSPFEAMELQYMMYIGVRFIDIGYFSAFIPQKPA